tara:strand:+ start:1107 stop:2102 length:996 start_codon:yes stop_codon:yes gene_type:complete
MKIDFFASNPDISVGSYRIWVHDLQRTLLELGHDVEEYTSFNNFRKDSIIILSKADYHLSSHPTLQGRCVGGINVAKDHGGLPLDFIIVGSPEEKTSLMTVYDNVCVVNLYERMYENQPLKSHSEKDDLCIGYHGSYIHLVKLGQGFSQAFKKLSQEYKLHFFNITNNPKIAKDTLLKHGFSREQITCKKWQFEDMLDDIKKFDIGVMPNLIDQSIINPEIAEQKSVQNGINTTDYVFRFKNKSNPGRAFVFYQLAIPVVADLTPSNMPMLYDETCGYVAQCERSWIHYIERLMSSDIRNQIAIQAYERFCSLYDPKKDANQLIEKIKEIK